MKRLKIVFWSLVAGLCFNPAAYAQDETRARVEAFYAELDRLQVKGTKELELFFYNHLSDTVLAEMTITKEVDGAEQPPATVKRDKSEYLDVLSNTNKSLNYTEYSTEIQDYTVLEDGLVKVMVHVTGAFENLLAPANGGKQDMGCIDILDVSHEDIVKIARSKCSAQVTMVMIGE